MTDMNTPEKKNPKKLAVFLLDALMDTDASHTKTTAMLQEEIRNRWKDISGKDDTLSEKTIQNHIKDWNESELYSIKSNKGGNNRGYYMDEFPIEATDISHTEENHKRMAAGEPPIMSKIEALKLFALDRYARENVYMYHNDAPPADIKLFFREDSLETVISQFGLDKDRIEFGNVTSYFTDGEQVCTATVTAQPNEGLYQWLLQHSNHVIAVKPDYVREEVHRRLKTALKGIESYEDGTEDIDEYAKSSRLAHDVMMQHRMGVDMRIIKFE